MSFIRYKQRGTRWYAYQVENIWDKESKKYVQHSIYMGVADSKGGTYSKKETRLIEKGIIDFGDSYIISKVFEFTNLNEILAQTTLEANNIMNLVCYQLTSGSAMYNCKDWLEGNIAQYLYPNAYYNSQKISKLLIKLGDNDLQMKFFKKYIENFFPEKRGILIDSTALPNAINTSISSWGYSATKIDHKVGCLMLVDQKSKLPIFFRAIAGEIADISTLQFTINEIHHLGLNVESAIFDAGYFSEENIKYLCNSNINFVSRMPKSRIVFKELIHSIANIESPSNAVLYGKRIVFIQSQKIKLYEHDVFAHIILDLDKKAKDTNKILSEYLANPTEKAQLELQLQYSGFLILISKNSIEKPDILPTYYTRQSIEQIFGFAKINNLLPLRVHSEQAIKGYLFLVFISIIIFVSIRQNLDSEYTVEQVLLILRNWKGKLYDKRVVPMEANKKIKSIFKQMKFTVPISVGI